MPIYTVLSLKNLDFCNANDDAESNAWCKMKPRFLSQRSRQSRSNIRNDFVSLGLREDSLMEDEGRESCDTQGAILCYFCLFTFIQYPPPAPPPTYMTLLKTTEQTAEGLYQKEKLLLFILKGQCLKIFDPRFFYPIPQGH
jgi:hypothetical protein